MRRRTFLKAAGALGASALLPLNAGAQSRPLAYADMHAHLGVLGRKRAIRQALSPNGMLVVARKLVADSPVTRRTPGKGIQQVREPAQGELSSWFESELTRAKAEHKAEGLTEIVDAETLKRVLGGSEPAIVIGAEGGDFIDGDLKRLEAARREGLVHLQIMHYRVSDIGDISTAQPVHNGLTAFGREVIAACERLGILVDVAHCTNDGIAQALEVAKKPMVYSHGSIISGAPHWTQNTMRARAVSSSHARRIAERGGVIGIWPHSLQYSSLDSYASALIDSASTVGPAHVGIGTDLNGLFGLTVLPGYEQFGQLEETLVRRGVRADDVKGILGGNYLRVLGAALA